VSKKKHKDLLFELATDRYHFFGTDIFKKKISPILGQLPIFDWPPIPIFRNLLTDIFTKCF